MSRASGNSWFGVNFSASFQTRFFKISRFNPKSASATKNCGHATLPTITSSTANSADNPDYQTLFGTITSSEQKERYEKILQADLEECRSLYPQVAKVCERLDQLIKDRRRELESANLKKIEEIEGQIHREYDNIQRDPLYGVKLRFDYLHQKSTHLQQIIDEYDTTHSKVSSASRSNVRKRDSNREHSNPQKNAVLTRVFFYSIQRKRKGTVEIGNIKKNNRLYRNNRQLKSIY